MKRKNGYAEIAIESSSLEDFLSRARSRSCRIHACIYPVTHYPAPKTNVEHVEGWVVEIVAWWTLRDVAGERSFLSTTEEERNQNQLHIRLDDAMNAALQRVRDSKDEPSGWYNNQDGGWRCIGGRSIHIGTLVGGEFIPAPKEAIN